MSLDISQNSWAERSSIGPLIYMWPINLLVYLQKKLDLHAARKSAPPPPPPKAGNTHLFFFSSADQFY